MNIGFVSIYAYRPHVEYLVYLSKLLAQDGHKTFFFVCDASVPKCYSQLLKGHGKIRECPVCILGGFRGYPVNRLYSIKSSSRKSLSEEILEAIVRSSAFTIHRVETNIDCESSAVKQTQRELFDSAEIIYGNTIDWIRENQLDGVVCFNGRMALTRAITYTCQQLDIPYITAERTTFGDGLRLVPNGDCLSLKQDDRLHKHFSRKFLTLFQAKVAAKLAARRFLRQNVSEWRVYNQAAKCLTWPLPNSKQPKVLILPSSRCEFAYHDDYDCGWQDMTTAIDDILTSLGVNHSSSILRCHPNWAEYIGRKTGTLSEQYYIDWAKDKGVYFIPSQEKADTYSLMAEADIIIVNGSSCGFEAALLGKKVICIGAAFYREAGFVYLLKEQRDLEKLRLLESHDPIETVRRALRYIYTDAYRIAQYTDFVRPDTPTQYNYFEGANSSIIINMLKSGMLSPNDTEVAEDPSGEDIILKVVLRRNWKELVQWQAPAPKLYSDKVERQASLRWIEPVRELFPTGDR